MKFALLLAAFSFVIGSVQAYAQDSVEDSGSSAKATDSSNGGDPEQSASAQGSKDKEEATNALPVFCPTGKCYGSVYGGSDSSDCAAGGKGASPGQDICTDWTGGAAPAARSQNGRTAQ